MDAKLDDTHANSSFWADEENFWLEGPDFFRANMLKDAVMTFPKPTGTLVGKDILAALQNAPRWDRVTFSDRATQSLKDAVRITYRAEASRFNAAPYRAQCESTYVKRGGDWFLSRHAQIQIR